VVKAVLLIALIGGLQAATRQDAAELTKQANQLYVQSLYTEAEPVYRRALEAWTELGPDSIQERAIAMRDLGTLLRAVGRFDESETLLKQSLHDLQSRPERVRALWNLATLYRLRGEYEEAERYARLSIETAEGEEQRGPKLVLASIYIEQRRYPEAIPILLDLEKTAGEATLAAIYNDLATIWLARGEYPNAAGYSRKAVDAGCRALGPNHPAVAAAWNTLGQAFRFQGRYLDAETSYRESIAAWEKAFGPANANSAKVMMNLAALYHQRDREAGAENLYVRAASILETRYGKQYPTVLVARNELADVLRAERRYTESAKLGNATLQLLEQTLPWDDPRLTDALVNHAKLLRDTGHRREAAQLFSRVQETQHAAAVPQTAVPPGAGRTTGALLAR
jgi:tetratricopeptide (TPR) repeat protein